LGRRYDCSRTRTGRGRDRNGRDVAALAAKRQISEVEEPVKGLKERFMKQPFPKTALAILLVLAASHPTARADIFQWQFINPADPGMGKQQSTTLCIDGAGAGAFPRR
jgi:hypothetical protein